MITDFISLMTHGPFGVATLLTIVVLAIITGKLVPKKNMDRELQNLRQDRDERIEIFKTQASDWKVAHGKSEETRALMAKQIEELLSGVHTSNHLIESLKIQVEKAQAKEGKS